MKNGLVCQLKKLLKYQVWCYRQPYLEAGTCRRTWRWTMNLRFFVFKRTPGGKIVDSGRPIGRVLDLTGNIGGMYLLSPISSCDWKDRRTVMLPWQRIAAVNGTLTARAPPAGGFPGNRRPDPANSSQRDLCWTSRSWTRTERRSGGSTTCSFCWRTEFSTWSTWMSVSAVFFGASA